MAECGGSRSWEKLIPDILGLIFHNLSLQDKLTLVPLVCKSWNQAVCLPSCWQEIDINEWSRRCTPEKRGRMLRLLISRSCGSFRRISVYQLPNDSSFSFIADHAGSLQTLQLLRGEISDATVVKVAPRLSRLTFLDLSYCQTIGAPTIEAFGKHCKSLVVLSRMMHPFDSWIKGNQDDEAHAISCTMTQLRHLKVGFMNLTNRGVRKILLGCRDMEVLDIRGCFEVNLEVATREKPAGLKVLGPLFDAGSYVIDLHVHSWDPSIDCCWELTAEEQELIGAHGLGGRSGFNG